MNRLSPYAALVLRLAVGGVFLRHGLQKFHMGVGGVSAFLHGTPGMDRAKGGTGSGRAASRKRCI